MNTASNRSRAMRLDGTRNFRDLGGLRGNLGITKRGLLFRSERLSELSDADAMRLAACNIRTIIDLRGDDEIMRAPNRLPRDFSGSQLRFPIEPRFTGELIQNIKSGVYDEIRTTEHMLRQYEAFALEHAAEYRSIIESLLEPQRLPAVVHCTSGKDRTGVIVAIILLALGVPRVTVIEDYVLSDANVRQVDMFSEADNRAAIAVVMAAKARYIETTLNTMEQTEGTIDGYLTKKIGLSGAQLAQLRTLLLET